MHPYPKSAVNKDFLHCCLLITIFLISMTVISTTRPTKTPLNVSWLRRNHPRQLYFQTRNYKSFSLCSNIPCWRSQQTCKFCHITVDKTEVNHKLQLFMSNFQPHNIKKTFLKPMSNLVNYKQQPKRNDIFISFFREFT